VAIFDTRDIAPEQAGAFLHITLRQFLFFSKFAEAFANNHGWKLFHSPNDKATDHTWLANVLQSVHDDEKQRETPSGN